MLDILYQDEFLVAVNKPSGLLVHRSMLDKHETQFAMQLVRDQIGQHVYTVHRLDRPTSGVLIMALSSESARKIGEAFQARQVHKHYIAITRGHIESAGLIDHELTEKLDKIADKKAKLPEPKEAQTEFKCLGHSTLNVEINRYPESRFSLVELMPKHGRKHQIRRHLAHLRHPIIYDVNYGDNKYNRYFKQLDPEFRLALHAKSIAFKHPYTGEDLLIDAPIDTSFKTMLTLTQLDHIDL